MRVILIVIAIAAVSAIGSHAVIQNYLIACLVSVFITLALVSVVGQSHFRLISTDGLGVGVMSLIVSMAIGGGFRMLAAKKQ